MERSERRRSSTSRSATIQDRLRPRDVNGDGKPDVATFNDMGPCVAINAGDGTFGTSTCYTGSANVVEIEAVVIADVNNDQKGDLVVYNYNDPTTAVNLYLNKGDGTFGAVKAITIPPYQPLYGGYVLDMNNDGKADLVMSARSTNTVMIMNGNGDGTFGTTDIYAQGVPNPNNGPLVVGNFLNDGLRGFLTADSNYPDGVAAFDLTSSTCRTTIPAPAPLLANGSVATSTCATANVAISAAKKTTTTTGNTVVYAIDLNGDKKADLVQQGGTGDNTVFNYSISNGDGTFKTAVDVPGSPSEPHWGSAT